MTFGHRSWLVAIAVAIGTTVTIAQQAKRFRFGMLEWGLSPDWRSVQMDHGWLL